MSLADVAYKATTGTLLVATAVAGKLYCALMCRDIYHTAKACGALYNMYLNFKLFPNLNCATGLYLGANAWDVIRRVIFYVQVSELADCP